MRYDGCGLNCAGRMSGTRRKSPTCRGTFQDRLSAAQFQALYLEGDELPLISRLLNWTVEWLRTQRYDAHLAFPFEAAPPSDERTYWARLLPLIDPSNAL